MDEGMDENIYQEEKDDNDNKSEQMDEEDDSDRLGGVFWEFEGWRSEESRQLVTNLITNQFSGNKNPSNTTTTTLLFTSAVRSWPVQRPFHGGPTSLDPFLPTSSLEPFLNWNENVFFSEDIARVSLQLPLAE